MKKKSTMASKTLFTALALLACLLAAVPATAFYGSGAVYSMTNDPGGNEIVVFDRSIQGDLEFEETVPTGGNGYDNGLDSLGSQGALIMTGNKRWLLAANAGSNDISVFRITPGGLYLTDTMNSGGQFPSSLTVYHNLVYVLNSDALEVGTPNISGFTLSFGGELLAIPNSTRNLNGTAFSQIQFDNYGSRIVLTDRGSNEIHVFRMRWNGRPETTPEVNPSEGAAPFGFLFDKHNRLVVSEAGSGAVSSYRMSRFGGWLRPISSTVQNNQAATCWIASTPLGHILTANTASSTLSSYKISPYTGRLKLIDEIAGTGDLPLDMDTTPDGRFLYVLNAGPGPGSVGMFRITPTGGLIDLGTETGYAFEIYAQGMVAR